MKAENKINVNEINKTKVEIPPFVQMALMSVSLSLISLTIGINININKNTNYMVCNNNISNITINSEYETDDNLIELLKIINDVI